MLLKDITTSDAMETWKKGSFTSIVIFRRIDHALLTFVVLVLHFAIFQTFKQKENTLAWVLIDDSFFTSNFQWCCLTSHRSIGARQHIVSVQPSYLLHDTFRVLFVLL